MTPTRHIRASTDRPKGPVDSTALRGGQADLLLEHILQVATPGAVLVFAGLLPCGVELSRRRRGSDALAQSLAAVDKKRPAVAP